MATKKLTPTQKLKNEVEDLKTKLSQAIEVIDAQAEEIHGRVTDKDFYQGAAWGAGVTAVLFIVGILLF